MIIRPIVRIGSIDHLNPSNLRLSDLELVNFDIQLQEFEVGRSAIYAMKPGYFRLYFHNLIMQLHS